MDKLDKLILDIENLSLSGTQKEAINRTFELRPYQWLIRNLVGGIGTLFIRSILFEANINEHHVFRWRLENKYVQYLVLNYYNPDCMPETISLSKLLSGTNGDQQVRQLFEKGFFLKATLSECTGKTNTFDRTNEFDQIIGNPKSKYSTNYNEQWILQKKLNLQAEFRIHSFSKDILYGLTFKVTGVLKLDNYSAESFVKNLLDNMPDPILKGTLIAWDIGLTIDNQYYVIESNFTGFHPVFNYGFQTSGYFQDRPYGPISCAWLNMYIKNKRGVSVSSVDISLLNGTRFFTAFIFYLSMFRYEHFEAIEKKSHANPLSVIIYISDESNSLFGPLIEYFLRASYADMYYIITTHNSFQAIKNLFGEQKSITYLHENALYTVEQYQLITQLKHERRKQISCRHAQRMLKKHNCVTF